MAPTPVPYETLVTDGIGLINDLGLITIILAGAVIGLGAWLLGRVRRAVR